MQSLKKIHAWAQMKVPLFSVSFLNMIKKSVKKLFYATFLVYCCILLYIFVFVLLSYEIYCLTIQCNDKKVHSVSQVVSVVLHILAVSVLLTSVHRSVLIECAQMPISNTHIDKLAVKHFV